MILVGSLVAISQCQLAFATQYDYSYDVHGLKDGADGETYSYR